ncbi:MAG TPA: hypothetical protein VMV29_22055, partial [Ktedonobacterales bacterium]|nr:hypothetical protein [Ktedonobacterales bacterium]HUY79470.1 hypothetical protein [Ktedonobacterales bacterium]
MKLRDISPVRWVPILTHRLPRATLLIGVATLLVALLLGAGAGQGATSPVALAAGAVSLTPTSGPPGTHLLLSGSGFTPGEKVEPIWNYTGPKTGVLQKSFYEFNPIAVADATGAVTTSFWVSATAAKSYTVALQGLTSGTVATASYQVTPSVDLGAYVGPTGTTLRLRGWGFAAKEAIQVYWNYQQSGQVVAAKASTDSKGDWSGKTFVVPSTAPAGTYPVAAVGTTSHLVAIG